MKRVPLFCFIFCMLISITACTSEKAEKEKFCVTSSISLNKICAYYDGQWQGIIVASDGACYFGASSHSMIHGGGMFRFDPVTKQFDVLTEDLTRITGDDITVNTPQGKCHSPIIEINGTLYLSTHLAAYWPDVVDRYAGSHILSYNIHEKKWHDFGVVKTRYSTYSAIEVDTVRGKIYAMIVPFSPKDKAVDGNHIFEIDIKTHEKRDLGRVGDGKGQFYFYLDDKGKLWSPIWYGKQDLHCYDPELDSIITYHNAWPDPLYAPDGKPADNAQSHDSYGWLWATPIDGRKRCLFTMGDEGGGDERLWIFDPRKSIETGEAFTPVCWVGNTFLAVALGGERVYFIEMADNVNSRNYDIEAKWDLPSDSSGYHPHNLHLMSVALDQVNDKHPFIDHGRIIDQDGRTPSYIAALAADDKGNIFMDGTWIMKSGDATTVKYQHNPKDGVQWKTMRRGQQFAWVNISGDLK